MFLKLRLFCRVFRFGKLRLFWCHFGILDQPVSCEPMVWPYWGCEHLQNNKEKEIKLQKQTFSFVHWLLHCLITSGKWKLACPFWVSCCILPPFMSLQEERSVFHVLHCISVSFSDQVFLLRDAPPLQKGYSEPRPRPTRLQLCHDISVFSLQAAALHSEKQKLHSGISSCSGTWWSKIHLRWKTNVVSSQKQVTCCSGTRNDMTTAYICGCCAWSRTKAKASKGLRPENSGKYITKASVFQEFVLSWHSKGWFNIW